MVSKNLGSFSDYASQLSLHLDKVDLDKLELIEDLMYRVDNNSKIFLAGNGGSHAIVSHFATDLERTLELLGNGTEIVCLGSSTPNLTATANDFNYGEVFSRAIYRVGDQNDLLFVVSSSGNSLNIINSVMAAKEKGMKSVALIGFNGGKLKDVVDVPLVVETTIGAYALVEDCHSAICHFLSWNKRPNRIEW